MQGIPGATDPAVRLLHNLSSLSGWLNSCGGSVRKRTEPLVLILVVGGSTADDRTMSSDQRVRTPMFVDRPETGLVLSGLRRYNMFTAAFFLGRQRRLLTEFADRCGLAPGEDVLDIGCGPGKLVRVLGRRVGSSGTVTGVDPSPEAIAYNRRRSDQRYRYQCSAAQALDLPDAAFDVVTCTFVMHHIPERFRNAALAEMWRVLRPGGRLLLADAIVSERVQTVSARINRRRSRVSSDPVSDLDIRRYSETLRAIGFTEPQYLATSFRAALLVTTKPVVGPDREEN
jgi:demethylmenaquinone methyltransferase/2-methoxy-6-polyprenyl-1,4-benzoquinol methylase